MEEQSSERSKQTAVEKDCNWRHMDDQRDLNSNHRADEKDWNFEHMTVVQDRNFELVRIQMRPVHVETAPETLA